MGRQGSRHSGTGTGRIIRRGPSPIKKISEDDIEAVVESIKNLTRIKNNNDLFPQLGKHYFDDWFESLSNGVSWTLCRAIQPPTAAALRPPAVRPGRQARTREQGLLQRRSRGTRRLLMGSRLCSAARAADALGADQTTAPRQGIRKNASKRRTRTSPGTTTCSGPRCSASTCTTRKLTGSGRTPSGSAWCTSAACPRNTKRWWRAAGRRKDLVEHGLQGARDIAGSTAGDVGEGCALGTLEA